MCLLPPCLNKYDIVPEEKSHHLFAISSLSALRSILITLVIANENSKHAIKDNKNNLAFAAVAAVTFSNGGGATISVFIHHSAKYNSANTVISLTLVFLAMTAIWCMVAYYLVNHPLVAKIRHTGHIVLPFVFIGLGIYILAKSFIPV